MFQLLKPFLSVILKWGTIGVAGLLILFKIRQSGEKSIENKEAEQVLKGVETHDKIANDVNNFNPIKLEWMRKKYNRD